VSICFMFLLLPRPRRRQFLRFPFHLHVHVEHSVLVGKVQPVPARLQVSRDLKEKHKHRAQKKVQPAYEADRVVQCAATHPVRMWGLLLVPLGGAAFAVVLSVWAAASREFSCVAVRKIR